MQLLKFILYIYHCLSIWYNHLQKLSRKPITLVAGMKAQESLETDAMISLEPANFGLCRVQEVLKMTKNKINSNNKSGTSCNVGGQALIEGLLMLGPESSATAIRKPDGQIVVEKKKLPPKSIFSKIPVVRGVFNFVRQMITGVKALMYSAEFMDIEMEDDYKPSKLDKFIERIAGDKFKDVLIYFSVFIAIILGIGLFMLLPNFITSLFVGINKTTRAGVIVSNLLEGVIRIIIFMVYLTMASKLEDIKRVWQYHGAEHKTIHCFENNEELTVENVQKYSTKHPRCGTSFLFIVMIVSIIVFSFAGWHGRWINLLLRLLLIPVVAGISYELLKLGGKSNSKIIGILKYPGLWLQNLTTSEPDDDMVEVAITALKAAIEEKTTEQQIATSD